MRVFGFLFDPDNLFGRVMTKIGIIVITNLLFILFSIPIVTIGASYTAMYHVLMKEFRSKSGINPVREFWEGFRSNWKQATIIWLISIFLLMFGWLDIYWCRQIGGLFSYLEITIWSMGCVGIVVLMYLFPTVAAFADSIPHLARNAIYFVMKKPLIAVLVAVCNVFSLAVVFLDERNRPTYAFILFFGGFALIAAVCAWLLLKVFSFYLDKDKIYN